MLGEALVIGGTVLLCFLSFSMTQRRLWGKTKKWKCERCGRKFSEGWLLEFHHRIPSHLKGTDTEENAELLCLGCHAIRHREMETNAKISAQLIEERLRRTQGRVRNR